MPTGQQEVATSSGACVPPLVAAGASGRQVRSGLLFYVRVIVVGKPQSLRSHSIPSAQHGQEKRRRHSAPGNRHLVEGASIFRGAGLRQQRCRPGGKPGPITPGCSGREGSNHGDYDCALSMDSAVWVLAFVRTTAEQLRFDLTLHTYLILVSAVISSLPLAVLIVAFTHSPLPPPSMGTEMRFPPLGSACTASSYKTASPRFNATCKGVAGSRLTSWRFARPPSAARLTSTCSFASVTLLMPTVGL